jgi:glutathione synthase/RimK-type ligase-like ATP-grasp enzyme
MAKTYWVGERKNLPGVLDKIKTDWVVLKPHNGMKGIGIFIGPKDKARLFQLPKKKIYSQYIAQEFVDTSAGIPGIVRGQHDLRVAVANGEAVWSHVRTPPAGSFKANVAQGGEIKEVVCEKLPEAVKRIVAQLAERFYQKYDNPIYSIDFGMGKDGPLIFELNDQIGFPTWEMKNRETFLQAHIKNFAMKLKNLR